MSRNPRPPVHPPSGVPQSPRPGFHTVIGGADMMYTDLAFTTAHPPDVPPRSRLVAVCGITDFENSASPGDDGWFFSDFYLFHHLFNPIYTHTSAQAWLTCLDPEYLVDKYREYAHGDPRKERRVVLERDLLRDINRAGNIRVVAKEILLERFVKTVEEQANEAKRHHEHLILLLFGHGHRQNHGVYIGGKNPNAINSVLHVSRIQQAIPRGVNTTLLLTSCYSGGWLIQPDMSYQRPLNVTGIAASGLDNETRSWSMSKSAGRACGSTIASAILTQLIKLEENEQEDEDPRAHPSYIDLARSIYDMAIGMDTFFQDQNVHFSAQDDDWAAHWRSRTGTPLAKFKERWEMLREIPPSGTRLTDGAHPIGNRRLGSLKHDLQRFATEYLNARPGRDSLASNTGLHGRLNQFFRNNPLVLTPDQIQRMLETVTFRLNMMADADEYIQAMGLQYPSCFGFCIEEHDKSTIQNRIPKAYRYLMKVGLFSTEGRADFPSFSKPINYVAIVLAERCHSEAEMQDRVKRAVAWKELRAKHVLPNVQAHKIINNHHIRSKLYACFTALRSAGHRMHVKARTLNPSHRGYSAVPCEDIPTF
ncbi:hypothetical protein FE257_007661 [Aspergillus nanangensis]|uniref:Uncharacterized protein n=1 Tax=Aspergillus nanangensis TaxID=2582783 RepID=A0AAD4CP76_ASPNN|nr:hypothetical protein FE257_007661 [Aspergillus nanangensis]